ncbi:phosphoribosylaminoimidazolesuccinocarboxamide synthase [Leuconostoc carnosum]|uniref:phosphoribosylaminoimidazolesuccinocarboxamide synthase n=1 Tax=Leuconostoc carnosum TaxID=1252 RepID=UPI00123AC6BC|nr:phosphoribosylaminoimidazolesuccinocarboxamide synthase [Leuconostoc carnosum]KAA8371049.1 phosphoribosylaminoimidazolesuccinocarboxamide synthase [Leuconostoc carnosum]KAA8382690.1 phosphoribosylaminoimidazolesuccinocarboxamide synthase [Leuconostoc carnosum]
MNSVTYKNRTIEQGELKYTGKAKEVYTTNDPDILWIHYLDQATAKNGKEKEQIDGKGQLNSAISQLLFDYLTQQNIKNHYLLSISKTDELVQALEILPIEVVTRNYASGHFVSKFQVTPMKKLTPIVQEFYYKSDALDDPFINDSQILALGYAVSDELIYLRQEAQQIDQLLSHLFSTINIQLIDFKLEFGRTASGSIILADELSPDNMRLVDLTTGDSLDKDIFREHKGDMTVGYHEVLDRLSHVK